jgi:hypothetical protein
MNTNIEKNERPLLWNDAVKTFFLAMTAVIGIMVASRACHFIAGATSRSAIIEVLQRRDNATAKFQADIKSINGPSPLAEFRRILDGYTKSVQSIDCSACPTDFQEAWYNYTCALQDVDDSNYLAKGLLSVFEIGMSVYTKDGKLTEDAFQGYGAINTLRVCQRRCARIAIAHGVSFLVTGHFKTSQPGSNQNRPL